MILIFGLLLLIGAFVWLYFIDPNSDSDTYSVGEYVAYGVGGVGIIMVLWGIWKLVRHHGKK